MAALVQKHLSVDNLNVTTKQSFTATVTPTGTTGPQTINKPAGTVNFAAGVTALTVTNNLTTVNSIVMCVVRTNDLNASIFSVVPAAGSFTINLSGPPIIECSVGFVVYN